MVQERDQNIHDLTREAERLNQELLSQIEANDLIQKKNARASEESKKRLKELEQENRLLKQQNQQL